MLINWQCFLGDDKGVTILVFETISGYTDDCLFAAAAEPRTLFNLVLYLGSHLIPFIAAGLSTSSHLSLTQHCLVKECIDAS